TRAKKASNRVLQKNNSWEYFKAYVDTRLKDVTTKKIYAQRKIDVEPAFGYLKASLRFTRLSVRGKEKVKNELGFALLAVNLRKYTAKGSKNKCLYFHFQQKTRNENLFARFSLLVSIFQDLCPSLNFLAQKKQPRIKSRLFVIFIFL
ncbi:transposase, partial [Listeria seeligeri]|uniref:transposase n=1 Tax=Listeria seeligeri TaxID=1640 RepID=UPI0016241F7F